jgi:hypothetical protein
MPTQRALLAAVFLLWTGCGEPEKSGQAVAPPQAAPKAAPYLLVLEPRGTTEKTSFGTQPDGSSALAVRGKGFDSHAVITANGQRLETVFGNSGWLTTTMPCLLYEKSGVVSIKVVNPDGRESNPVDFKVTAGEKR